MRPFPAYRRRARRRRGARAAERRQQSAREAGRRKTDDRGRSLRGPSSVLRLLSAVVRASEPQTFQFLPGSLVFHEIWRAPLERRGKQLPRFLRCPFLDCKHSGVKIGFAYLPGACLVILPRERVGAHEIRGFRAGKQGKDGPWPYGTV